MSFSPRPTHWLRSAALATALVGAVACSDPVADDGVVSDQARAAALQQAAQALQADRALANAQLVDDLTAGAAVGLATETAGLSMELPDDYPTLQSSQSFGARLAAGKRAQQRLDLRYASHKSDPQPGDILFETTEHNLDGSVSVLRVIQDSPLSVVKVTVDTSWPNGHLLLEGTHDELLVDRGADLESEQDDVLLALQSDLEFRNLARLSRFADERATGGIVDGARVELTSLFTARPNHPRLVDIRSLFTVDIHDVENESDDRFVEVTRDTRFAGTAHDGGRARVEERLTPSEPVAEGEQPCGGEASRAIYFRADAQLVDWTDQASLDCQGGGALSRTVRYADGTMDQLAISEDAQGVVSLSAVERSGATTTGSFDPGQGTFELETGYPQGSDPVARAIQGQSNPGGSDWSLDEQVEYADGFVEANHLEGREDQSGKSLAGSHAGRAESIEFALNANPDQTLLAGWIENDRDERLEFDLELLPDGGRILDFLAVNPTTRVEGHFDIGADGCGSGTLIVEEDGNRATIELEFCGDTLHDDSGHVIHL